METMGPYDYPIVIPPQINGPQAVAGLAEGRLPWPDCTLNLPYNIERQVCKFIFYLS